MKGANRPGTPKRCRADSSIIPQKERLSGVKSASFSSTESRIPRKADFDTTVLGFPKQVCASQRNRISTMKPVVRLRMLPSTRSGQASGHLSSTALK